MTDNVRKKKLRDLTMEEYKKFCMKYNDVCAKCPFRLVVCCITADNLWINNKDLYSDKFLEQEIEVEDE